MDDLFLRLLGYFGQIQDCISYENMPLVTYLFNVTKLVGANERLCNTTGS